MYFLERKNPHQISVTAKPNYDMILKRLKELRNENNLTPDEIDKMIFCEPGYYELYEDGVKDIPLWGLIILAQRYGVTANYIIGLTDEKKS